MTDERIIAYLLEELTEEEAERFEEECFAQEESPDEIEAVENDLIDDYLRNQLAPERRQRFEEKYLNNAVRRERVEMAKSFLRVVAPIKPSWTERFVNSWKVYHLIPQIAASVAAVVIIALLVIPSTVIPLTLSITPADRANSVAPKTIPLPPRNATLRVSLTLPEPSSPGMVYHIQWQDVRRDLGALTAVSQDSRSITVDIPARTLDHGRYSLNLYKLNPDGTQMRVNGAYYFNVE